MESKVSIVKNTLGEIDISKISIRGLSLNEVSRKFRLPDFIASHLDWFDWVKKQV